MSDEVPNMAPGLIQAFATQEDAPREGGRRNSSADESISALRSWTPKTRLGREVMAGRIITYEQAMASGLPIREVEIVDALIPNLEAEIHRMWQAFKGFTWAFEDYAAVNLTEKMGSPEWEALTKVVDPIHYFDRLKDIPKYIVVSSNDEFMMFDWTNIYFDKLGGEKHLVILPNAEHTMATNLLGVVTSVTAFSKSIAHGITSRPTFNYTYDPENG